MCCTWAWDIVELGGKQILKAVWYYKATPIGSGPLKICYPCGWAAI